MLVSADVGQALFLRLRALKKYRDICDATIRDVIEKDLLKYRKAKELESAVRAKLHKIAALYLESGNHAEILEYLNGSPDEEQRRFVCRAILESHASTRERMPHVATTFSRIFEMTGTPKVLLDVACAYDPFSFPWMGLSKEVQFHAIDINQRIVSEVNRYFLAEGLAPLAAVADVIANPPTLEADVALFLKTYHCLEARERGAGLGVIRALKARHVVVSFPTKNLQGQARHIRGNYEQQLYGVASAAKWFVREVEMPDESILLITKW